MGVANSTVAPSLAITRHVSATVDEQGVVMVCGIYSIDNRSEGGAYFIGGLAGSSFIPTMIAQTQSEQLAVNTLCSRHGIILG